MRVSFHLATTLSALAAQYYTANAVSLNSQLNTQLNATPEQETADLALINAENEAALAT